MLVGNPPLARRSFAGDAESRRRQVERQMAFLARQFTPRTVFLNLGAGDGTLALRAAGYAERVYALDLHPMFVRGLAWPGNVRIAVSPLALPDAAVDLAFSDRPLELEALRHALRSLVPGGVLFQLLRHDAAEAAALLAQAGFARIRWYALLAQRAVRCPAFLRPALLAGIKSR